MTPPTGPSRDTFVSEELRPLPGSFETAATPGQPALPRAFKWRDRTLEIAHVRRTWKTTGPCTHGSSERYVRRHWYDIATTDGQTMQIYFERKARSPRQAKHRWWVYSVRE